MMTHQLGRKSTITVEVISLLLVALCNISPLPATAATKLTTRYTYDPNGNLKTRTDGNGAVTMYDYDAMDRLIAIRYPDSSEVTFTYDAAGQRTQMTDALGTTEYEYDIHGRLIRVTDPNGHTLEYQYDSRGLPILLIPPEGPVVGYTWDANGQLTAVQDVTGTTHYEYDLAGRLTKRLLPNGVTTRYQYDEANRLNLIEHTHSNGALLLRFEYQYDVAGNRTQVTRTLASNTPEVTRYKYDALYRLTQVVYPDGESVAYEYDATGNRLAMISSKYGRTSYRYNRSGQLIQLQSPQGKETFDYDANGNLIARKKSSGEVIRYAWDFENRLIGVTSDSLTIRFGYDGDGRRLRKVVNGQKTEYVQHGFELPQVLLEWSGAQTTRALLGLSRTGEVNAEGGRFCLEDGLGSVVAVVDSAEQLFEVTTYDTFGAPRSTRISVSFGYANQQLDKETGLIFLRRRYYDPALGRFISRDPVWGWNNSPQTLQSYVYALNNPVKYLDPDGEAVITTIMGVYMLVNGVLGGYQESLVAYNQFQNDPQKWLHTVAGFFRGFSTNALGSLIRVPGLSGAATEAANQAAYKAGYAQSRQEWRWNQWDYGAMAAAATISILTPRIKSNLVMPGVRRFVTATRGSAFRTGVYSETISQELGQLIAEGLTSGLTRAHNRQEGEHRGRHLDPSVLPFWNDRRSYFPPFPPGGGGAAVGGVALDKAARVFVDFNDITGASYDPRTGQLVLIGRKDLALPAMNMDDLVVAIRTLYSGQEPSMSIEPCNPGVRDSCMKVHYNGRFQLPAHPEWGWVTFGENGKLAPADPPAIFGTHFGWVLFESDRYLKSATLGQDNLKPDAPFVSGTPGYVSLLQRKADRAAKDSTYAGNAQDQCSIRTEADRHKTSNCYRLWFVPGELNVKVSADGRNMEFEPVTIKTEARYVRFDTSGQMVDVPGNDPEVDEFVAYFNEHYRELAKEKKELAELIQLAKVVGLVRWLRDKNIPLDMAWLDRYRVASADTTLTTPGIFAKSGRVMLYGGVDFTRPSVYVSSADGVDALAREAKSSRTSLADLIWEFQQNGDTLTAIALNLTPAEIIGGYVTAETDAFVPLTGGLVAEFTRRYNSLDPAPGPFGHGWSRVTHSLSFRQVVAPDDPNMFYTRVTVNSGTSRTDFTLNTEGYFSPVAPNSPYRALGLTAEDPYVPLVVPGLQLSPGQPGQPPELRNAEGKLLRYNGFALLRKDGSALAFDPRGRLLGFRDGAGNEMRYTYDGDHIIAIGDRSGRGLRLVHDEGARLVNLTTSDGRAVNYTYDASGNLISLFDESGTPIVGYAYDSDHRLIRITNRFGDVVLENSYDALGRVIKTRFYQGHESQVRYESKTNTVFYTDASGRVFSRQYDDHNRLVKETDPWNHSRIWQYDEQDHPVSITDCNGNTTILKYDSFGLLQEVISPLGQITRFFNNPDLALPQMLIDPLGRMSFFEYDSWGRLTRMVSGFQLSEMSPGEGVRYVPVDPLAIAYEYDSTGKLAIVRSSNGSSTRFNYDDTGNLISLRMPGGGEITRLFDQRSRLSAVTNASGYRVEFNYDSRDRLTSITTPVGVTRYQYANGHALMVTDPMNHTTRYEYNPAGLLASVTEPGGVKTVYEYDLDGNLVAIEDASGRRVEYQYDGVGRLIAEIRTD